MRSRNSCRPRSISASLISGGTPSTFLKESRLSLKSPYTDYRGQLTLCLQWRSSFATTLPRQLQHLIPQVPCRALRLCPPSQLETSKPSPSTHLTTRIVESCLEGLCIWNSGWIDLAYAANPRSMIALLSSLDSFRRSMQGRR